MALPFLASNPMTMSADAFFSISIEATAAATPPDKRAVHGRGSGAQLSANPCGAEIEWFGEMFEKPILVIEAVTRCSGVLCFWIVAHP